MLLQISLNLLLVDTANIHSQIQKSSKKSTIQLKHCTFAAFGTELNAKSAAEVHWH